MPDEWIIFVYLVQKALVGQNVTAGPFMYKYMKRDAKAEYTQQASLVGSCTFGKFTMVMVTMTVHIFPVLVYQDHKHYMFRYILPLFTFEFTKTVFTFYIKNFLRAYNLTSPLKLPKFFIHFHSKNFLRTLSKFISNLAFGNQTIFRQNIVLSNKATIAIDLLVSDSTLTPNAPYPHIQNATLYDKYKAL